MPFCKKCGAKVGEDEVFCSRCGTRVEDYRVAPVTVIKSVEKEEVKKEEPKIKEVEIHREQCPYCRGFFIFRFDIEDISNRMEDDFKLGKLIKWTCDGGGHALLYRLSKEEKEKTELVIPHLKAILYGGTPKWSLGRKVLHCGPHEDSSPRDGSLLRSKMLFVKNGRFYDGAR
ncbi:MAG: zinc-ribbon domain-containing protein [Euryarchaeota archaeon]|nr:zinc-ribbon domain-containing protein [Euryarchaeota archaeon]